MIERVREIMIKLSEILEMEVFRNLEVVAGKEGIDREVATVSVMDAPDIYNWMKGGEFLITSGYSVKDDPEYLESLIENLDKNGASALGVKLTRFIPEFPQSAIEKANELKFPLIYIPYEFAFTDVINPVLQEIIDKQSRKMQYSEKIHESYTKMVLADEKIPTILSFLEENIHCEVAFIDTCFYKIYFAEKTSENQKIYQDWNGVFEGEEEIADMVKKQNHYRVYINEEEYGYIIIGHKLEGYDATFIDYYQIAIEQVGTILILKIQKQLATAQIESNYREQFVQDMLLKNINSKEEIINRATIYNWDFYLGGVVVIVDIDHFKDQYLENLDKTTNQRMVEMIKRILNISKRMVNRYYSHYVYSTMSDQIVFIISDTFQDETKFKRKLKNFFEEIKEEIRKRTGFTATIGVGNYRKDISQIHDSWKEAKKAVVISRSVMRENSVATYAELGVFKLLSLVSASEEAEEFQQMYVAKLKEYDDKYGTEMLKTAQTLIACGWSLKETSGKLFIHYNSMKYRYHKIEKILNIDIQDKEERLNLELALKLYQIKEER